VVITWGGGICKRGGVESGRHTGCHFKKGCRKIELFCWGGRGVLTPGPVVGQAETVNRTEFHPEAEDRFLLAVEKVTK